MTREALIDIIRRDLHKQAEKDQIAVMLADTPDSYVVTGTLDLNSFAAAILYFGGRQYD